MLNFSHGTQSEHSGIHAQGTGGGDRGFGCAVFVSDASPVSVTLSRSASLIAFGPTITAIISQLQLH
jgi:hypothetical protein